MKKVLRNEWFRSLIMALLMIAVLLVVLSGQQFVDASLRMQSNPVSLAESGGEPLTLDSDVQTQGLVAAGIEYRDLLAQRNRALILGGAGLILLGISWFGLDLVRSARSKSNGTPRSD